ncbi:MAG: CAP domain-containing protein [Fimbriimonadaceae bacterium]
MQRFHRAVVLGGLALALGALAALAGADLFARIYGPRGKVMVRTPTLQWEVWTTGPDRIAGASATVNGREIPARYDEEERRIVAQPIEPLAPGEYEAELSLQTQDGFASSKKWTFRIAEEAIDELPESTAEQRAVLEEINRYRVKLGLDPGLSEPRLDAASLFHSRYNWENKTTGHYQTAGRTGFFGNTPQQRLEAFGFIADHTEVVTTGSNSIERSVKNLFDAPYHRVPFLQPGPVKIGCGFIGNRMTVTFSQPGTPGETVSPADGETGVPISWTERERPNPLRIHPTASWPPGYPLVYARFGPSRRSFSVRQATLQTGEGSDVPVFLNTPANDDHLANAIVILPRKPLAYDTAYVVRVDGETSDGTPFQRVWRFTTASAPSRNRPR